jgi:hypothetical protein
MAKEETRESMFELFGSVEKSMVVATWVLAISTVILAIGAILYTKVTRKLYTASEHQAEAIKELTKVILQLPGIEENIQVQKKLTEEREKAKIKYKRNVLTGQGGD